MTYQADLTKDIDFLREMQSRLDKALLGDAVESDYVRQMIEDWLNELCEKRDGGNGEAYLVITET